MQDCFRLSELGLRGPRSGLESGPRTSGGVPSAPCFAETPSLPTKTGIEGVRSREHREHRTLQSARAQ
eukprot:6416579-Alexandrium_andersonii.AAC.1